MPKRQKHQNIASLNDHHPQAKSNNLFPMDELKSLTLELIQNLRNCKSKSEFKKTTF